MQKLAAQGGYWMGWVLPEALLGTPSALVLSHMRKTLKYISQAQIVPSVQPGIPAVSQAFPASCFTKYRLSFQHTTCGPGSVPALPPKWLLFQTPHSSC